MKNKIFILAVVSIILAGCGGPKFTIQEGDEEITYRRAEELYNRGKYSKVIVALEKLRYSPSVWADDAHLLTARAYIANGEPSLATSELRWLIGQYSQSELVEEASFLLGEAYREQAPRAELDQETTEMAINAYNDFIELYPFSEYVDSAKAGIGLCEDKLAHKQYLNAELYYKLKQDSSAVIYINDIRVKNPDSRWRLWADFLEVKILLRMDEEQRAAGLLDQIILANPEEKLRKKVEKQRNKLE